MQLGAHQFRRALFRGILLTACTGAALLGACVWSAPGPGSAYAADAERQSERSPSEGRFYEDPWFDSPLNAQDWDPFAEMQRMQEQMNLLFEEAFGRFGASPRFGGLVEELEFEVELDLEDEGDRYIVTVDVPGTEDNLDIKVEERLLTIQGMREERSEASDAEGQFVHRERRLGRFSRSLLLPERVDPDGMTTTYEEGVLKIVLPKESI